MKLALCQVQSDYRSTKTYIPFIDAPRKPPIALKDYIKQELDNMVKNKIIRKETKADPVLDQLQGIIKAGWLYHR